MPRPRLLMFALGMLLAVAGPVSAVEPVDVTGTVVLPDGSPAAGVEVLVGVAGSDIVQPVTTAGDGTFSGQVLASVGDTIEIRATGATTRTGPDAEGCVQSSTPTGRATVTIEALPLDPVRVVLDTTVEDTVCATTAPPARTPRATPPATDTTDRPRAGPGGLLAVVGVLATVALAAAGLTSRRRSGRTRG